MVEKPKVSVLIPTYNGEDTVLSTIDSILSQGFEDFEILICDDGSTDGTRGRLVERRDPRIRIMHNEKNRGLSPTLNRLIREASGQYIAFLDQDDLFLPNKLSRCVEVLDRSNCAGVSHDMKYLTHDGTLKGHLGAEVIFPSGFMGRAELVKETGGYREDLVVADSDFFCRFRALGPIRFIHEPLTAYRLVANSASDMNWFDKRLVEQWYEEYPDTPMPFGTTGHREWFQEKPLSKRIALYLSWYGQRCGRRAAAYVFADRYLLAMWYSFLSVLLNPSYLIGRAWKMLLRRSRTAHSMLAIISAAAVTCDIA